LSRFVHVAVPVPSLGLLTYGVPADLSVPSRGARVLVPLGPRVMTGCAIGGVDEPGSASSGEPSREKLRDIFDVIDEEPFLPPAIVDLCLWVAEYYFCGPGEALAAAMPPRAWVESERRVQITDAGRAQVGALTGLRGAMLDALSDGDPTRVATLALRARVPGTRRSRPASATRGVHAAVNALERLGLVRSERSLQVTTGAFRTRLVATLTAEGHEFVGDQTPSARIGPKQQAALEQLRGLPEGMSTRELEAHGIARESITRLVARGLVRMSRERVERDPFEGEIAWSPDLVGAPADRVLTAEQEGALGRLGGRVAAGVFQAVLLHGVTGSGKTEVYLRLAREARAAGRRSLVLVPEIALTPVVAATFRHEFGDRVAVLHSGLSDGERHDQWHRIRRGEIDAVVGTRSAVFAPLDRLGLIIVDEEHDGSYKQEEAPRYNGRDVAVVRAKHAAALIILGSATPAMETYQNALDGRYQRVDLARRIQDRPLAAVRIVDMRAEYAAEGPEVILSQALTEAVGDRLAKREQTLVLLNRRGFATAVFCRQCGATLECPNCSVSLTVHRAEHRARCHYCNHAISIPKTCAACAGPYLELSGFGTERVEREILERFPRARVARLDRDTIRRRGAIVGLLRQFAARELDIIVGTQMIAKGHDFPSVTLVGVVSADVGLGLADFRAAERTFQLLTQVAGRAGRGDVRGEAIVQTLYPDHYSIRHACRQDYAAFFEDEIRFRRAMRYPPAVALVNVVVKARTRGAAMADAADLARALRGRSAAYCVLGPAPAPLGRLRGEHRAQLFLKSTNRRAMREALDAVLEAFPDGRRVTVDVDPMTVL
jgi:primosomal protein N' (replication factor Y)